MEFRRRRLFSPSQILRQAGAVILYGLLARWRFMPRWLLSAKNLLPLVAGSEGMGCIGFPKHPVVEVTQRCNLQCIHCHADSNAGSDKELSFEQMRHLLREIAAQPEFKMIVFSGGEPLLREDIFELCDYASRLGLWPVLATNGTLLDRAAAERLRRAGVCGAAIGLDGDCPSIHDEIRGEPGGFRKAIEGCLAVKEAGLVLQINTTVMQQNRERLPQILRLSENLGAKVVLTYFCAPCGRGGTNKEILLDEVQYEKALRQIAELQRRSKLIVDPICAPTYRPMLCSRGPISSLAGRLLGPVLFHGCVAGTGLFYVRADGEAQPCPFLPVSAGNVLSKGVSELWRNGEVFETLRAVKFSRRSSLGYCGEVSSSYNGEVSRRPGGQSCSKCEFHAICGGCRARAFWAYNDLAADDPFCFRDQGSGIRDKGWRGRMKAEG